MTSLTYADAEFRHRQNNYPYIDWDQCTSKGAIKELLGGTRFRLVEITS
jgi:hypothetical protein